MNSYQNIYFTNTRRWELEETLNLFGKIPVISTLSGCVRVVIFATHALGDTLRTIHLLATSILDSKDGIYESFLFVMHDVCNIGRGAIELIPFIGNLTTFLYDYASFRFRYDEPRIHIENAHTEESADEGMHRFQGLIDFVGRQNKCSIVCTQANEIIEYLKDKNFRLDDWLCDNIRKLRYGALACSHFRLVLKETGLALEIDRDPPLFEN